MVASSFFLALIGVSGSEGMSEGAQEVLAGPNLLLGRKSFFVAVIGESDSQGMPEGLLLLLLDRGV